MRNNKAIASNIEDNLREKNSKFQESNIEINQLYNQNADKLRRLNDLDTLNMNYNDTDLYKVDKLITKLNSKINKI
jgi:hypothetical protein